MVSVGIYEETEVENLERIVRDTQMVVLVCTGEKAKDLKKLLANCPTLQHIVVVDK